MTSILHPVLFQDLLFHELHHRFYNSLQVVSSAVGFLDVGKRPDEIRALRDRIATLGGLHRTLARPLADLDEMRESLEDICLSLTHGFGRGTVSLTLTATEFPKDPMVVRGLALILVELVTNALKHGASDNGPVRVFVDGDERNFRLSVVNSVIDANRPNGCVPQVAARFVEALGGTLTIASGLYHLVHVVVPIAGSARGSGGDTL